MALKPLLLSIDDLPDPIKALYKKTDDGKFALDVEDMVEKAKLDEFRSNNRDLKEQLQKLNEKVETFKDIDPAKYRELIGKLQSDEEKKLLKDGNVEEVIRLRTTAIIKDRDDQLAAKDKVIEGLTKDRDAAVSSKDTYIIENELRRSAADPHLGFYENAADLLRRDALDQFILKDGIPVRINPSTKQVIFGKNGDPETMSEWLAAQGKKHANLVKPSNGSGASQNGGHNGNGKSIKRAEFEKLDHSTRSAKMKEGVTVTD